MNVNQIADAIRAAGHPVISVEVGTDGYDASIGITPEIDVQVGRSYMVVNRWIESEEAMKHCPQRTNVASMVEDIAQAIKEHEADALVSEAPPKAKGMRP